MSSEAGGPDPIDDHRRAVRAWLAAALACQRPDTGAGSGAAPGGPDDALTVRPVPELVDRLDAGACLDECALIDTDVGGDGRALSDDRDAWEGN